jgi:hypothetical protein
MKAKNKHILFSSYLVLSVLTGCITNPELLTDVKNAGTPILNKVEIVSKTASSITLNGYVTDANGYSITERGFCWDTIPFPEAVPDRMRKAEGKGLGEFSTTIERLQGNTHYYIRPYAKNQLGYGYGDQDSVITNDGLGRVRTLAAQDVRATTAICGGQIVFPGEGTIDELGVYISTQANMADKKVYSPITMEGDSFICIISGLVPSTQHYVLAFVKNTFGIFYGDTVGFNTREGRPVVDSVEVTVGFTNAFAHSQLMDGGDAPVTECGFCWDKTPNPTIESALPKNQVCYVNSVTGPFTGEIKELEPHTRYYIRAFAKNTFGVKYSDKQTEFQTKSVVPTVKTSDPTSTANGTVILSGQVLDKGKSDVISCGICYSSYLSEPSITNGERNEMAPEASGTFRAEIAGLKGNTTYHIRAYAINNEGIAYGEAKTIETPPIFSSGLAVFPSKSLFKGSPSYFMIGNKGYLLGGDTGPQYTGELWSYDWSDDQWKQWQSYPKESLKWQAAVGYNTNVYVLGGMDEDYEEKNDFYQYNSFTNMWSNLPSGPDSACLRVGCAWNDKIYYVGGLKDSAKNEVWAFEINTMAWIQEPDLPAKQYGGIALTLNDHLYVGLGKNTTGVCNKTLWKSADAQAWAEESVCPSISGGIVVGAVYRNKIYVIDETSRILEYDPSSQQWTVKSRLPINDVHCMYVMNNLIYIGLGSANSLIVYNPAWDN